MEQRSLPQKEHELPPLPCLWSTHSLLFCKASGFLLIKRNRSVLERKWSASSLGDAGEHISFCKVIFKLLGRSSILFTVLILPIVLSPAILGWGDAAGTSLITAMCVRCLLGPEGCRNPVNLVTGPETAFHDHHTSIPKGWQLCFYSRPGSPPSYDPTGIRTWTDPPLYPCTTLHCSRVRLAGFHLCFHRWATSSIPFWYPFQGRLTSLPGSSSRATKSCWGTPTSVTLLATCCCLPPCHLSRVIKEPYSLLSSSTVRFTRL